MRRVIVCGSRAWADPAAVGQRLDRERRPFVLIHGDCRRGADAMADRWARAAGVTVEAHPADWRRLGTAAGPARNRAMLAAGADLVIAFRAAGRSNGTDHMVRIAGTLGVPVEVVR